MLIALRISPEVNIVRAGSSSAPGGFGISIGWLGWTGTAWLTGPAEGPTLADFIASMGRKR